MFLHDVDYSKLLDLTVDFAFKLYFGSNDQRWLISLLNAINANKGIPREVTALTITNPEIGRKSKKDKLSELDIRAKLANGSEVCIEMHMYDFEELKLKVVRNWARVYGDALKAGERYIQSKPTIFISFIKDAILDNEGSPINKIHSLFYISERDDHNLLTSNLELHFINMKAFITALCQHKAECAEIESEEFKRWLAIITHASISDKSILSSMYKKDNQMTEAMEVLAMLSLNKKNRQAYQRRLDELRSFNNIAAERDASLVAQAEKDAIIAEKDSIIAKKDTEIDDAKSQNEVLHTVIAEKDTALSEKDTEIALLRAKLNDKS